VNRAQALFHLFLRGASLLQPAPAAQQQEYAIVEQIHLALATLFLQLKQNICLRLPCRAWIPDFGLCHHGEVGPTNGI